MLDKENHKGVIGAPIPGRWPLLIITIPPSPRPRVSPTSRNHCCLCLVSMPHETINVPRVYPAHRRPRAALGGDRSLALCLWCLRHPAPAVRISLHANARWWASSRFLTRLVPGNMSHAPISVLATRRRAVGDCMADWPGRDGVGMVHGARNMLAALARTRQH